MPPTKVLLVFGTRPEAIKLAPVILECRRRTNEVTPVVCVTGQHRSMLDSVLSRFGIRAGHDLDVMAPNQTLNGLTARVFERLDRVLESERPDFALVQGDTTTTMAAAVAAFYRRIPVGHVEAGLRTGDLSEPFPEEANRVLATRVCDLHFAPTERARQNLLGEGIADERIHVTGNTAIDALLYTKSRLESQEWPGYTGPLPRAGKKLVVVTAHRRESFGDGFERICDALIRIAERDDVEVVYPVHLNPNVRGTVERRLTQTPGVHLIEPLDYVPFIDLMLRADVLLTDSGGVQEEGPALNKPVLVMRDKTERQEAVEAGKARLVGTDPGRIYAEVAQLLVDAGAREAFTRNSNPFGDGLASGRIIDAILRRIKG